MTDTEAAWIVGVPNALALAAVIWQTVRCYKTCREATSRYEAQPATLHVIKPQRNPELQELVERMRKRNNHV